MVTVNMEFMEQSTSKIDYVGAPQPPCPHLPVAHGLFLCATGKGILAGHPFFCVPVIITVAHQKFGVLLVGLPPITVFLVV